MTIEEVMKRLPYPRTIYSGFCKSCNDEFYTYVDRGNNYCSANCSYQDRDPAEIVTTQCFTCKTVIKRAAHKIRGKNVFCSRKCLHKWFEVPSAEVICTVCNKILRRKRYWMKHEAKNRFCSQECRNKFYIGENHYGWKGGTVTSDGYRELSINGKKILEHRHIMSQKLGRTLYPHEQVHHKDGNRANNNLDNLELCGTMPVKNPHVPGQRINDILDAIAQYYPEQMQDRLNKSISKPIEPVHTSKS